MSLPSLYVVITQREYKRLSRLFERNERMIDPLYNSMGFLPQINIKGVPLFTQEQVRYLKKEVRKK